MRKLPVLPTLVVLLAVATMVWLGAWQLQRRAEKETLLARAAANLDRATVPLPAQITDALLFARVSATCASTGAWTMAAGRAVDDSTGYRHIVACRTTDGRIVPVDKGVSTDFAIKPVWAGGPVTGTLSHAPGSTSLLDRLTGNATPPQPMIVADTPAPGLKASRRPDPASLPNNHLAYAVQWFAFAVAAIVIYLLALRRRSR